MLNQTNQVRVILAGLLGFFLLLLVAIAPFVGTEAAENLQEATEVAVDGETAESSPDEPETVAEPLVATRSLEGVPVLEDDSEIADLNPIMQIGQRPDHNIITYTIQRGDTPNTIAEKFGIQSETILGGNSSLSDESSQLQAGVQIRILPIDGVLHEVSYGETLESIAETYEVTVDDIIAYEPNNLDFPYRVYRGTEIMVPGAVREVFTWTPPKLSNRPRNTLVGTGTFVQPVRRGCVTQYFYPWHRGLDVGAVRRHSCVCDGYRHGDLCELGGR